MQPRSSHSVQGRVEAANATGVCIAGEWYNRSRFHPVDLPKVGDQVSLDVDDKGYIRSVDLLEAEDVDEERFVSAESATRLAVLQAAAAFGASRPDCKSDQVLVIAERWLEWVNREESST